jgi:hypothetical protein
MIAFRALTQRWDRGMVAPHQEEPLRFAVC